MSLLSPLLFIGRRFWSLTLIMGLAACVSTPTGGGSPILGQQAGQQSDILAQTSWQLLRWTTADGVARAVPGGKISGRPVTLLFTHEQGRGQMSGYAGCNTYSGQYVVANGQLLISSRPVSTLMACSEAAMRFEHDYLEGLTRITSSRLDSDTRPSRLTMSLSSGDVLDFERLQDPLMGGQRGPTKLVYVAAQRVPCSAGAGRAMCYQVRDDPSQPWQLWYGEIQGFKFHPGIEYRLRVVEVRDPNPPADASAVRWVLDLVVEQRVVQR